MSQQNQEKYKKHYDNLMNKGKNRKLDGYKERHHIIPRCMGGSNDKDNLVELTPEEHFVAHQLLIKIFPDDPKIALGAFMMTYHSSTMRINNKAFGWLRKEFAKSISKINKANAATRGKKAGDTQRGKVLSDDHKEKLRIASFEKTHSEETKRKMSQSALNLSDDKKQNRLACHYTPEYKIKLSNAAKGKLWISNPISHKTKFVHPGEAEKLFLDGWVKGRLNFSSQRTIVRL